LALRKKAIAIICGSMILLCLALGGILGRLTIREYSRLEEEDTALQVKRATEGLRESIDRLGATTGDWAPWDETYAFIQGDNPDYIRKNVDDSVFLNLGLSLVAFVDSSGSTKWARAFDRASRKIAPTPTDFVSLPAGDPLLRHADARGGVEGFIRLSGNRLMLVASRPITSSDFKAPVVGTLIMGRMLDAAEIGSISKRASIDLAVYRADDPGLPPDFARARSRLSVGGPPFVAPLDDERVAGYSLLEDIRGEGVAMLRVVSPRGIYRQGLNSLGYMMVALGLAALFASALVFFLVELLVLGRLSRLGSEITRIGAARDLHARVEMRGDDELAVLANTVNMMLPGLEASDRDLKASLAEKELLLREIHHRVKNNLQVVSSLLNLQLRITEDVAARNALMESQGRIHSMALIHEFLYKENEDRSPDLARVGFREYLRQLSAFLADAYHLDASRIRIEIDENEVYLDADTAVSCGLLVNELVSNCLEHAFPDGRSGRVSIGIRGGEAEEVAIFVKDDGIGFPPGFDPTKAGSMGWQLIRTLARQLDGRIEIAEGGGSSVGFFFRAPSAPRPG
jgi:two-component sensor histidine kinase/sensor domain CHASE-containing protein